MQCGDDSQKSIDVPTLLVWAQRTAHVVKAVSQGKTPSAV